MLVLPEEQALPAADKAGFQGEEIQHLAELADRGKHLQVLVRRQIQPAAIPGGEAAPAEDLQLLLMLTVAMVGLSARVHFKARLEPTTAELPAAAEPMA